MPRTTLGSRSPWGIDAGRIGYAPINPSMWSRSVRDVRAALDLLAKSNYHPFDFIIENPTTADDDDISQTFPFRCVVRRVVAWIVGGTSVTINLDWRDDDTPSSAGPNIFSGNEVASAGSEIWTAFSGSPDSAGDNQILSLNIAAVSGAVKWMRIFGHCVMIS